MERLEKGSDVGTYQSYHFTAAQSDTAIDSTGVHGHFVGRVVVGTVGTSTVITIGNGTTTVAANVIGKFTPTQWGYVDIGCTADKGLYVAIAGTGFDVTIMALDMAM
jgi:hypothetical protein